MQICGSKYFARRRLLPPQDPRGGVKMSKLAFSEHGHVAYQIKCLKVFCDQIG